MNEFIWNGEMDYGWEGLAELLMITCRRFTDHILKTTQIFSNAVSKLIDSECMERFESIVEILAGIIKDGLYYANEDLGSNAQNAFK